MNLGVLAALTPEDVDVVMYDDRMEPIPYDEPTDLVAITVETYTARRSYEIADEYRSRGVPVIMGGFQPTFAPEECAPHTDLLFVGDAETLWADVIEDARRGALKPRYDASPGKPQTGTITRRDIYKGKGYLPISLLQFTRGCRFVCDFCAVTKYFDRKHYLRAIDETLQEVADCDHRLLFFVDDNIASNREALEGALPRADPDAGQLGEPGIARHHLGPRSHAAHGRCRLPRPHHGLRVDHQGEHQGGAQGAEHAASSTNTPRRSASCANTGCRPGPPSRSATTTTPWIRCARRSISRSRTASPSRPSTS